MGMNLVLCHEGNINRRVFEDRVEVIGLKLQEDGGD
jgi:hypothetical protein